MNTFENLFVGASFFSKLICDNLSPRDRLALACCSKTIYSYMQFCLKKEHLFNHFGYVNTNCYEEVMFTNDCEHSANELKVCHLSKDILGLIKCGDPSAVDKTCCISFFKRLPVVIPQSESGRVSPRASCSGENALAEVVEPSNNRVVGGGGDGVAIGGGADAARSTRLDVDLQTKSGSSPLEEEEKEAKEEKTEWVLIYKSCQSGITYYVTNIAFALLTKIPGPALICHHTVYRMLDKPEYPYTFVDDTMEIAPFQYFPPGELGILGINHPPYSVQSVYLYKGYESSLMCFGERGALVIMEYHSREDKLVTVQIILPSPSHLIYQNPSYRKASMMNQHYAKVDLDYLPEYTYDAAEKQIYQFYLNKTGKQIDTNIYNKVELDQSRSTHNYERALVPSRALVEISNVVCLLQNSEKIEKDFEDMTYNCRAESDPWFLFCSAKPSEGKFACSMVGTHMNNVFVFTLDTRTKFLGQLRHLHGPSPPGSFLPCYHFFHQMEIGDGLFTALVVRCEAKTNAHDSQPRSLTKALITYDYAIDKASYTLLSPDFPTVLPSSAEGLHSFNRLKSGHLITNRKSWNREGGARFWTFEPFLAKSWDRCELQLMPSGNFKLFSVFSAATPYVFELETGKIAVAYISHSTTSLRVQIISANFQDQEMHRQKYGVLKSEESKCVIRAIKRRLKKQRLQSEMLKLRCLRLNK